jgi:hypothetical protein
MMVGWTADL